jgi:hypothetical protein
MICVIRHPIQSVPNLCSGDTIIPSSVSRENVFCDVKLLANASFFITTSSTVESRCPLFVFSSHNFKKDPSQ